MDARTAAQRWARIWQNGWNGRNLEPIVALYAARAVFSSQPFRVPYTGREGVRAYVAQAFGEEDDVAALFGEPLVDGERAAVRWWATLREGGRPITLAGTSVLRFDADGLVAEQWDTWNEHDGHVSAPDWLAPSR